MKVTTICKREFQAYLRSASALWLQATSHGRWACSWTENFHFWPSNSCPKPEKSQVDRRELEIMLGEGLSFSQACARGAKKTKLPSTHFKINQKRIPASTPKFAQTVGYFSNNSLLRGGHQLNVNNKRLTHMKFTVWAAAEEQPRVQRVPADVGNRRPVAARTRLSEINTCFQRMNGQQQ